MAVVVREVLRKVARTEEPVLIDVKVTDARQLPAEQFPIRASDRTDFADFRRRYRAEALEPFADIAARHGIALR